jgi:putative NADPH-quinone reductase
VNGFAPELEREIRKLESCDLLIFSFPIWWFAMPAILKGWVDRAFPMRRIYGDGKLYDNELGKAHKRAMILMTVGGGPDAYGGYGVNPSLNSILAPVQHGVFWFNGFLPLDPFIAWGPARISPEERAGYLQQLRERLRRLDQEMTWRLQHLSDFPGFGKDQQKRFMATLSYHAYGDGRREMLAPADLQKIEELMRSGVVLSSHFTSPLAELGRGFIVLRESDAEKALQRLKELPITSHCDINLSELAQI